MKVKWYSVAELLVGAVLSFADPITDILTLVEFYRADHKTWFGVGLMFVILPCLFYPVLYCWAREVELADYPGARCHEQTLLCSFHPFSPALRRLEGFLFHLRQLMRGDKIDSHERTVAEDYVQMNIFSHVFFESVLEAAPQFVIQLYAVNVQKEPVTVVQIISLPVSFLSLTWACSTVDMYLDEHKGNGNARKVKYKLALFVTHVLLLSSRLCAICYFTVSYKWWVLAVLFLHIFVLAITDTVWTWDRSVFYLKEPGYVNFLYCLNWLRDDVSALIQCSIINDADRKKDLRRMQLFSNVLFVLENLVMILLYYFSQHSNNWYSLPVTVCVCVLSVLAAVTRVKLFHILYKEPVNPQVNNSNNSPTD